ncbi:MAG: thioredoxin family protein [Anaerolineae bacterium]
MALLSAKDQQELKKEFAALTRPVKLVLFTQQKDCEYCPDTRQIVEEVAGLSDKIAVEVLDIEQQSARAAAYGIDKAPGMAMLADGPQPADYGIRYYGIPSGYEFASLIQDILMVSRGDSGLAPTTRAALAEIKTPMRMQVFVTPTCPYCPRAVHMAHQMAMENAHITADMVEAIEFPHLAHKYSVMGVPRTVINENVHVEGAVPEAMLLQRVMAAAAQPAPAHPPLGVE